MISAERIMGFVEGEGCFSIGIRRVIDRKPRKLGRKYNIKKPDLLRVVPSFRVTIREADNKILWEIKETLGIGQVYTQKRMPPQENISQYYTRSLEDCAKVRQFFEQHAFYTRKGQDFQLWCQCLNIINSGRHLTEKGLREILELRAKMNHRENKKKRTQEELLNILKEKPEHIVAHMEEKEVNIIHNNKRGAILKMPERGKQTLILGCRNGESKI